MALFDEFPHLENELIVIRKMEEDDVDALSEITENENVYKYIPYFLYKKAAAICWRPYAIAATGIS